MATFFVPFFFFRVAEVRGHLSGSIYIKSAREHRGRLMTDDE